ncbi:MAG: zf-HC2 domain-containing protein [Phycisphaeraceae bacterium]|nr:zf-HC2 domain-containing protein [Phycisphaerales bacterium]MCB9860363.1 zf-HC2 domain-containing protein [Phycisphaeraceae bacterium]
MSTNPENQSAGTSNLPPCPKAAAKICCEELTKFTIDYMDGELDPEVKRHFDSHLAFCPECKSFFDAYQCAVRMGKDCMCTGEPIHRKAPESLIKAVLKARGKCCGEKPKSDPDCGCH